MTLNDLINRVKVVPLSQAETQIKQYFIDEVIGKQKPGQVLKNRYKSQLKRKVREL